MELNSAPNWIRISVELPDSSLDDVRVTADDTSIRIRADPSTSSARTCGINRTITLVENVDVDGALVAYYDPTLTVVLPKRDVT